MVLLTAKEKKKKKENFEETTNSLTFCQTQKLKGTVMETGFKFCVFHVERGAFAPRAFLSDWHDCLDTSSLQLHPRRPDSWT